MIKKLMITSLLLLGTQFAIADDNVDQSVEMYVGEIKILQVGNIKRVAVGNAKLISTSMLSNGQLLLIAEAVGSSNVHIWFNDGSEDDIVVIIDDKVGTLEQAKTEVRELLADIDGLNVKTVGSKIILSGNVDARSAGPIDAVIKEYPAIMDLTVKIDPADSDPLNLPKNKMVFMNIKITEFNKNFLENLGIQWDNPISGPSAAVAFDVSTNDIFRVTPPTASFGDLEPRSARSALGYFGIATEISSRINFAVNSGNALILAQPRLATRSGGEASFLAGGEIPLQVTNSLGASNVEFKEFGISLSVKPEVDQNDNIRASVTTEVSAVDNSVAVQGIPGFLTRKTSSDISMRSGETLVLSGLINEQASKDVTGLKFLSDIPILGELFKSKTFRDNKSELVIFVTPTVFDADHEINKTELERRQKSVDDFVEAIDDERLQILD